MARASVAEVPPLTPAQATEGAPPQLDTADRFEDWSSSDSDVSEPEPAADGTGYWRPRRGAAEWAMRAAVRPLPSDQQIPRQRRGGWNITSVNLDGADVTQPDLAQALQKCMNTRNGRGGVIMM